jgi:protein ImuB
MVSVWLPYWQTERIERACRNGPPAENLRSSSPRGGSANKETQKALVIAGAGQGGRQLAAVNRAAEAAGLQAGMALTGAYAVLPSLKVLPAAPDEEAKDLEKLAAWCRRYTPWTAVDGTDGIALDVTGACHLLGGEAELLASLTASLGRLGLTARAAMAETFGAAWALSHYGAPAQTVVPGGEAARFIAPLPVKGLRLDEDQCALLKRLGLYTIGQLFDLPRGALRARLGPSILSRLGQALGTEAEPLTPLRPQAVYAAQVSFAWPISTLESLLHVTGLMAEQVTAQLKADGQGARHFTLGFYDPQGGVFEVSVALARPCQEPQHVLRLFREKFARFESSLDENLEFEAATLHATRAERLAAQQTSLEDGGTTCAQVAQSAVAPITCAQVARSAVAPTSEAKKLGELIDALMAKLGEDAVTHFDFRESYTPERAAISVPVLHETSPPIPLPGCHRPLLLLPRPEPLEVLAEVPDYPPRRFTWRKVSYRVVEAEGPERLSPEWWLPAGEAQKPRDYYIAGDESGRRFWLYREGRYGDGPAPRWYMHGLFA